MSLKELLKERGVTQIRLASLSGISASRMNVIVQGYFPGTEVEVDKICKAWEKLGFDSVEIFDALDSDIKNVGSMLDKIAEAHSIPGSSLSVEQKLSIARQALGEVKTVDIVPEIPRWLINVRKSLKSTGKAYKYNDVGEAIGEYDWDGNLKEY